MSLSQSAGEWAITAEPEMRFSTDGRPWLKIRGVSKDRKYNQETKEWTDGDPCYMDIVVNGKLAENVAESVTVGDSIVVIGVISQREWKSEDGKSQKAYSLRADSVGVSAKFHPVKIANGKVHSAPATLPPQEAGAPF